MTATGPATGPSVVHTSAGLTGAHVGHAPRWWTPVDGPRLATDQKVGGSSPTERAHCSWSEQGSNGRRFLRGRTYAATASAEAAAGRGPDLLVGTRNA